MNEKSIIGAIIGDIAGSRFEWNNYKSTDFPFFTTANKFTDDTVMTIAVADWLLQEGVLADTMHDWAAQIPSLWLWQSILAMAIHLEKTKNHSTVAGMEVECGSAHADFMQKR